MGSRRMVLLALLGMGACSSNNPGSAKDVASPALDQLQAGSEAQPSGDRARGDGPLKNDKVAPATDGPAGKVDTAPVIPDLSNPAACGNKSCEKNLGENCLTCPADCGQCCGDGICEALYGETPQTCLKDCPLPPPACNTLAAQYAQTLKVAKTCSTSTAGQCSLTASDKIACGCQTHVSSSQKPAISDLQSLQVQYASLKCPACQPPTCVPVVFGFCKAGGISGECADQYGP